MAAMNLAQELYLCALDGSPVHSNKLPVGIGGAILADLELRGRIRLGEQVELVDPSPTGDRGLDAVLEAFREGQVGDPSIGH